MSKTVALVGTDAIAEAMRQINPDVVPAYPITPQTAIVEAFAQMVADGRVDSEMINAESEHSAMSAAIGAAAAGARVMTATSAQGLALMWEMLYIASGMRLPIVMPNVNRALSAPINIHCDHSDSMGARDSGWIQLFSENAQEAYDNVLQAVRIAEDTNVLLPVMVLLDGFIISHSVDRLDLLDDSVAKEFVGTLLPRNSLLDAASPPSWGTFDGLGGYYFEFKRAQAQAMINAAAVVREVGRHYAEISGRHYDYFASYRMEDAELAVVAAGSAAGTIRSLIDQFRAEGIKIGMIKLRMFRPFPERELVDALSLVRAVAVFDRSDTFAGEMGGPLFTELRSAFYEAEKRPQLFNFIYGLGGRDLPQALIREAVHLFEKADGGRERQKRIIYLGLRD
jgi:pyruvate ferredoxin oxidoreductase alpha subunit